MKRLILTSILLLVAAQVFAQNTITFTAETTTAIGQTDPVLTWDTSPLASNCVASGSWAGPRGPSGTETLPTITSSATYTLTCEWINDSATLSWTAPTQNTDGSALTDLAGYKLYYGQTMGGPYPAVSNLPDPAATSLVVQPLAAGTWFFVATSYNTAGTESVLSNEAMKLITGTEGAVEAVSITVNAQPNPPVLSVQ